MEGCDESLQLPLNLERHRHRLDQSGKPVPHRLAFIGIDRRSANAAGIAVGWPFGA